MRLRTLLIALGAAVFVAAAGSVVPFAADSKRLPDPSDSVMGGIGTRYDERSTVDGRGRGD